MTMLPTPLPLDVHSTVDSFWFPRSAAQEAQNVIDACLYNCYDVPRAQSVFETIRENMDDTDVFFDISLYNSFLRAYIEMASEHDVDNRGKWVGDAWRLFDQCSADGVEPDADTYASMLLILVR
jgi:DNA-directed RNA polymerase, mitochondrial